MEDKEKQTERIHIVIDYFYIQGTQLFAVEKVEGMLQMPPRLFSIEGIDSFGNSTEIAVTEINYR